MDIPRLMVLKSKKNYKHLRYLKEGGEMDGYVQYSSDAVVTPYTRFEVERTPGEAGLLHIKSSYNNKYLVRKSADTNFIVAGSDEPEEDQSKWSCTLFQIIYDHTYEENRLRHIQLGFFISISTIRNQFLNCVFAESKIPQGDNTDLVNITDWQSLCMLPRFVTFKQGAYLKCFDHHDNQYLQFGASKQTDELAGHEVFTMDDGRVRIKSTHWSYWRRDANWIKADSNDTTGKDINTIFCPVMVPGTHNVVALQNMGNDMYCKRLTLDGKENCLNASVDSITSEAKMEVNEYVSSREIFDVKFQMGDARIYGIKSQAMAYENAVNSSDEEATITVKLSYKRSSSSTWEITVGMKLGVEMKLISKIPLVVEGDHIETGNELSGSYEWGEAHEIFEQLEAKIEVRVPARSMRKVSMVATEAKCDVPFSYIQKDSLPNGREEIAEKFDGIYTALNYYKFEQVVDEPRSLVAVLKF